MSCSGPRTTNACWEYRRDLGIIRPIRRSRPQMLRSQQAFWRDLPELLKKKRNRGKWVAYHGRSALPSGGRTLRPISECFRRGLESGEFYVGKLEADPEGIPPWGTHHSDWSLYEVTEEIPPDPS